MPLDPRAVEARRSTIGRSRYLAPQTSEQSEFLRGIGLGGSPSVLALDLDGAGADVDRMRVERRRDALESRRRWQFGLRSEVLVDARKE